MCGCVHACVLVYFYPALSTADVFLERVDGESGDETSSRHWPLWSSWLDCLLSRLVVDCCGTETAARPWSVWGCPRLACPEFDPTEHRLTGWNRRFEHDFIQRNKSLLSSLLIYRCIIVLVVSILCDCVIQFLLFV